jgi:hypothetical protein
VVQVEGWRLNDLGARIHRGTPTMGHSPADADLVIALFVAMSRKAHRNGMTMESRCRFFESVHMPQWRNQLAIAMHRLERWHLFGRLAIAASTYGRRYLSRADAAERKRTVAHWRCHGLGVRCVPELRHGTGLREPTTMPTQNAGQVRTATCHSFCCINSGVHCKMSLVSVYQLWGPPPVHSIPLPTSVSPNSVWKLSAAPSRIHIYRRISFGYSFQPS